MSDLILSVHVWVKLVWSERTTEEKSGPGYCSEMFPFTKKILVSLVRANIPLTGGNVSLHSLHFFHIHQSKHHFLRLYSHCTASGPAVVQGAGLAQKETMGHGLCPCLGPVSTLLFNPFLVLFQCSLNTPLPRKAIFWKLTRTLILNADWAPKRI